MAPSILVSLPGGGTRVVAPEAGQRATVAWLSQRIEELESFPVCAQRLVCGSRALRPEMPLGAEVEFVSLRLRLPGGGGDGDQPDWMERGKVMTGFKPRRGPTARAPDWHGDAQKYAEKMERDKRERGELVVQLGPFCVPCGKRFAKQTTYDAHLSGSKHLKALQKLGRVEEAMVCQIDVDAKRRKTQELEDARMSTTQEVRVVETEEEIARRRAEREEKLRRAPPRPAPPHPHSQSPLPAPALARPPALHFRPAPALRPPAAHTHTPLRATGSER